MTSLRHTATMILLAALAGCRTQDPLEVVPRTAVAVTGKATQAELATLKASADAARVEAASQRELAQRASGAVYGATNANLGNPEGLPKEAVAAQLTEAASALPTPTPDQVAAKEKENARILAGELLAVKAEMGQAISENQALKAGLAASELRSKELLNELEAATRSGQAERAAAAVKLQRQFDDLTGQVNSARQAANEAADQQRKSMLARLGYVLLGLGALFTIAAALQGYAVVQTGDLTPKGFLKPLVWAGSAAFCFACFWTINQPWFKWVVIIGGALGLAAGVLFGYSEWSEAKTKRAGKVRAKEADEAESTLSRVIGVFDAASSDTTLFDLKAKLAQSMSDQHKALIHELRAESKRT